MIKFLFQGDSITDADRRRDNDKNFGYGYPNLFAAEMLKKRPYEFDFVNCGISGDRIVDLFARIKCDIINLKPDYMSILIGVNDVWHELNEENGVATEKFEKVYDMIIAEVKEALPEIKIILLEPFVLKGPGTERYYEEFRSDLAEHAEAVRRLAEKYNLTFVPLQAKFDEVATGGNDTYWLVDGVHPTAAGHCLIKDELMKVFNN